MGTSASKFKKHIISGDEYAAMQIYQNCPELRKVLDPNTSFGEQYHHSTAMHFAAKHGMKHLLRIFLTEMSGDPNKSNARSEAPLHLVCHVQPNMPPSCIDRRLACLNLLLKWPSCGMSHSHGILEKVDLSARDLDGNTALHLSSASGLRKIVEFLVAHGAPLFLENNEKQTACDLAMKLNHDDIALFLETKMVFADELVAHVGKNASGCCKDVSSDYFGCEIDEIYAGLRAQDLQEAKDQLVVETADMLHLPLFVAESLLRENAWSRETLLEKWIADPVACWDSVGLTAPISALSLSMDTKQGNSSHYMETPNRNASRENKPEENCCGICLELVVDTTQMVSIPCEHEFCRGCWSNYLTLKIMDGNGYRITCPALACSSLVPVDMIEPLVSKETARKYLHFDLNSFVETNPSIKWCPMAGCSRAVRLPHATKPRDDAFFSSPFKRSPAASHSVDCGNGHLFCWECLGEAHAPAGCQEWTNWQKKVAEVKPEELKSTCTDSEDAANCYWLVTNCKACPNCKSPIQKNEGCNHMKCSKCKFDFCWVCLDSWKKHSTATGGYFRCNRYEAVNKADKKQDSLIKEAGKRSKKVQELNRFLHYYTRFKNHENSRLLEEPFLASSRRKMELLALSLPTARSPLSNESYRECVAYPTSEEATEKKIPPSIRFIEDGIRELLKSRRILCGSYVYGYYLEDNGYNKTIFEFMQNELESLAEKLSEMVARPYLRTPRSLIIDMTSKVRRKRREFVQAVSRGLLPPETPPALRRIRRRKFPGLMGLDPVDDGQLTDALKESLRQLDPSNPWVKDSEGKHTNLSALYDWPDDNSDEDDMDQVLTVSLLGKCERGGCGKPRARNPRNGEIHSFCSLRCSRMQSTVECPLDYGDREMDIYIALEMSRLQLIEDEFVKHLRNEVEATRNQQHAAESQVEDAYLQLAIQMSLEESRNKDEKHSGNSSSSSIPLGSIFKATNKGTTEILLRNFHCEGDGARSGTKIAKTLFGASRGNRESEGRFEISDIHQNSIFVSSETNTQRRFESSFPGEVQATALPRRAQSACDVRKAQADSSCLELIETHDCVHEVVEKISLGGPTRTLLRLQSLGTDYGSDDLSGAVSSEEHQHRHDAERIKASSARKTRKKYFSELTVSGKSNVTGIQSMEKSVYSAPPIDSANLVWSSSYCSSGTQEINDKQLIPRSPTLYISGITISRTPESLGLAKSSRLLPDATFRENRSASLTTVMNRQGLPPLEFANTLSKSADFHDKCTVRKRGSSRKTKKTGKVRGLTLPGIVKSDNFTAAPLFFSPLPSPHRISRSACEPYRDKEVFSFSKSPTEGQLSSVLLVRECNTRDAFHEALFFPRSPREQRRKRSKRCNGISRSAKSCTDLLADECHGVIKSKRGNITMDGSQQESSVL